MDGKMKEVRFDIYCPTCKFEHNTEQEEPCDECLIHGCNENSHKPVCWKGKEE